MLTWLVSIQHTNAHLHAPHLFFVLIRQTKDKQGEIEALLGKMSEADFPKLVRLGQNITDYGQDEVRNDL